MELEPEMTAIRIRRFSFLLLLLLPLLAYGADQVLCDVCHKPIHGQYSRLSNGKITRLVCDSCMKSSHKCQLCGFPVPKGRHLCDDCEKNAPTCDFCHKKITGKYSRFNTGQIACQDCLNGTVCAVCGRPVPGKTAKDGQPVLCESCDKTAMHCAACGVVITGRYVQHPFVDGVFCENCEKIHPKCSMCGRPIATHPVMKLAGERPICLECLKTSILSMEGMQQMLDESTTFASKLYGMKVEHSLPLKLVDDINLVRKDSGMPGDGKELGLFYRHGDEFSIYVLGGLPLELATETLQHEWTHAWFAENGHELHPEWVQEGFCQWMASKALKAKGYKNGFERLRDRNDLYGKGFRYVQSIEDKAGGNSRAVIEYMKSEPPAGAPSRKRQP